jgi:hypothetical protein
VIDRPVVTTRLEFNYDRDVNATIIPENPYLVGVEWDHSFDNGLYLWDYYIKRDELQNLSGLPVTIPLKAKGKIQVFKGFQQVESTEVEFSVTYKK